MGRSVSYLSNATKVYYLSPDLQDEVDWEDFLFCLTSSLQRAFPSLTECSRYDGREDRIFLENNHTEFGISEYCGLVSLSLRPIESDYDNYRGLSEHWINNADRKIQGCIQYYQPLKRVGTFSNGEGVFELAQ